MASRGCGSWWRGSRSAPSAWRCPAAGARVRCSLQGATVGLAGLLGAGFAIGARGWAFEWLDASFGALPAGQFGLGLGGVLALASLLMLLGLGLARRGYFRGDLFIACAVLGCGALLLLFVALPVLRALGGAFFDEAGAPSLAALVERIGNERVWGLGCLAWRRRCGVAWNTLWLGLLTAAGTTVLGTLIALLAERGGKRLQKPLQGLALLPIITPPFVVGLGLILLFGRAGLVNQGLEALFGVTPSRWFYGVFGIWLAQLFAFTPIAFMIMRGVVQGVSPSLEEAAQTLRAEPPPGLPDDHAAAAEAGPRQRLPRRLHREHGRLRQPDRRRWPVRRAVDRDLLRHRRRAVRPGPRGVALADPHAVRAGGVRAAAQAARPHELHDDDGQG